jgi:hypothetical protein
MRDKVIREDKTQVKAGHTRWQNNRRKQTTRGGRRLEEEGAKRL